MPPSDKGVADISTSSTGDLTGGAGGAAPLIGGLSDMVTGGGQIAMGFINAATERAKGAIVSQRAEFNARMSEMTAANVLEQADEDAIEFMKSINVGVVAKQKSAYAAQGVRVNTGVAKQMEQEARNKAQKAVVALRANAMDKAFGLRVSAMDDRSGAALAKIKADSASRNSILGGVIGGVTNIAKGAQKIGTSLATGGADGGFGVSGLAGNSMPSFESFGSFMKSMG